MTRLSFGSPFDIRVNSVDVLERYRTISDEQVNLLAGSMAEMALNTPIDIMEFDDELGTIMLIAGAGRLAAAKKLGWEHISARYATGSMNDARLWELDQSISSVGLTDLERRQHSVDRLKLLLVRDEENATERSQRQSGEETGRGRAKGFLAAAARETGPPSITVQPRAARKQLDAVSNGIDYQDLPRRHVAHCARHDSDADLVRSTVKFSTSEIEAIEAMRVDAADRRWGPWRCP